MIEGLPPDWHELTRLDWQRQTIGRSDADVFRVVETGKPVAFVKSERINPHAELPGEAARLRWLAEVGIACPPVIAFAANSGRHWLATGALGGTDLSSDHRADPDGVVEIYVSALKALHAIDPATCPFDHRLPARLTLAEQRIAAGLVDESDFDEERLGQSAAMVLAWLCDNQPAEARLVVTHGDACPPNLIVDGDAFSGFVDCGRVGLADIAQDLALAHRSIAYNFGPPWGDVFLDRYGASAGERTRLSYYRVLDEMF